MNTIIQWEDFDGLNEDYSGDVIDLLSKDEVEEIKAYAGAKNPEVVALAGDIDVATKLVDVQHDAVVALKLYKDILFAHPEWELTSDVISNQSDGFNPKILALVTIAKKFLRI